MWHDENGTKTGKMTTLCECDLGFVGELHNKDTTFEIDNTVGSVTNMNHGAGINKGTSDKGAEITVLEKKSIVSFCLVPFSYSPYSTPVVSLGETHGGIVTWTGAVGTEKCGMVHGTFVAFVVIGATTTTIGIGAFKNTVA
ncbi:hypothetical protein SARC_11100 [Sphaeroforma arctica JP610]|uniref:Uncharacterized protein n=1 Tax=Sphaeroforma arctica JP610 TaxID=667725 RepID=A0A0L0FHX8_9EUKA|nr:hypothetical protein SARC_11100 [Sphaeroforma arctica JP610]KNC76394.1 hypothetical protein SARC_11100 [Sphaeroforma arctica JP610]|eukprot:XP_014150296.1 hypothetical protein SARC_11100 [Sphaeroforma arctica JP610]